MLVLLARGGEIVLRLEEDVLRDLDDPWAQVRRRALEQASGDEDEVWQGYHDGAQT